MRIRWTTRIAVAVGVLTIVAGIAAGGDAAHAAQSHSSRAFTSGAAAAHR
jgi:hypothetical protein